MTITSSPVIAALVTFASSALVTTGVVPMVRRAGLRWGLIDRPDSRKQHTVPMVRLGGVAIVLGFCLSLLLTWLLSGFAQVEAHGVCLAG